MTASWVTEPWLALDVESSGIDRWRDRVVEVAAALVAPDGTVGDTYRTIVDPGIDIPDEAAAIHGITTERARAEGVPTEVALKEVAERLLTHGFRPSIAFNAGFDMPMLAAEAERHRIEFPVWAPMLDPFLVDKMVDKYRKGSRKLVAVAAHYGVELSDEDAHGALADAVAAARVMRAIVERHPEIARHTLGSVYIRQVRGFERWRLSFVEHKQKDDPSFYVAPGWPIPTDGVPAPLQVVKDEGSGEADSRETSDGSLGAGNTSPVQAPGVAGEGPASGGSTGEVAAEASRADAATEPVPRRTLTVADVGRLGTKVFRPMVGDERGVTARVERLRHALAWATCEKRSLNDCDAPELHRVYQRLLDIQEGRLAVEVDETGVSFDMAEGPGVHVRWSTVEPEAVSA